MIDSEREQMTSDLNVVSEKLLITQKELDEKKEEIGKYLDSIETLEAECESKNIAFESEQREKKMLQLEIQHIQKFKDIFTL